MTNLFRRLILYSCIRTNVAKLSDKSVRLPVHGTQTKEKPKERFLTYIFTRYVNLVKIYEETFPSAAKFYKTFSTGIKLFKDDGLQLFQAYKKSNSHTIHSLTRKELEIFHEMPMNMVKVAPIIVIGTTLPFGAAIFAVGCMFPKTTLSHHFWSDEQKEEFALIDHKRKIKLYKPLLSYMCCRMNYVKESSIKYQFASLLEDLEKGINPQIETILKCKQIFEEAPFSIQHLSTSHVSLLIRLHNLHRGWRRKMRLKEFAGIVKAMDSAILKEGGLETLSLSDLRRACFFRGLNPIDLSNEDIIVWLKNWLTISRELDVDSYSLLLHCPVLLSYNAPTNVALL
ncbi:UNVERIFIED_CONTAM: hypothetical protein PYX00_001522 [Menopon gallinae]|uniref:Letm1 RBD domain-containing protein n=1 Tax=Menopon gallinae TaxID=328185 RepID=A0AAW2IDC0_9NEOP